MNGWKWFIVGVCALGSALNIMDIGKSRKPTTPGVVLGVCIMNAAIAVAAVLS